ncbi:MAG: FxLYD domain-containing protein [Chloroflexi bacterium]|nr:FxLYD domain-containing protein [Chloroflexota bacterium]
MPITRVSNYTEVKAGIYLPLICKHWPPIPYDPLLNAIDNADGDSNYTVYWTEQPSRLADAYVLQEATDAAFTTGVRDVCTTAQQYCVVSGRLAGTYYYRVRGHNTWGDSAWSNVQWATALLPDTPTLYAIDNADGDSNYVVSWSLSARASSYTLQEGTGPAFSNPTTVYVGSSTSWSANGKVAGTYYYRVLASGGTGQSNWSATQSAMVLLPGTPYLNPIDNTDGDGNYNVTWNAAARATSYTLEEDTDPGFGSPTVLYTGAGLSWSAANQRNGTYYYRVKAAGPTGQSGWSNVQSVNVPARVSILNNHTTYRSGSYRYVVGEVYNNTPSHLRFVKITVNFFNGSQLVATDYTYTYLDNVHPYEKACFEIILDEPVAWDHYTFEAPTYWTNGSARPNLVVTTHSGGVYSSYYRIIGQIRNDETVTIRFVSAVVTLYDAAGRVVGCDYAYVSSTDLTPGQVSSFEIYAMPPNPSAVTSYVLQTDGMR